MADLNTNVTNDKRPATYRDTSSTELDTLPRLPDDESKEIFGCQQCTKVFNRRENLSRHLKTHDAAPSHLCSKCGKGFTRSDLLRRHLAGHERWDNQSPNKRGRRQTSKRPLEAQESILSESTATSSTAWSHSASEQSGSMISRPYGSSYRDVLDAFEIKPGSTVHNTSSPSAFMSPGHGMASRHDMTSSHSMTSGHSMASSHSMTSGHSMTSAIPQHQRSPSQQARASYQAFSAESGFNPSMSTQNTPTQSYHMADHLPGTLGQSSLPHPDIATDFSSFLLSDPNQPGYEWFSYDFYYAMRESGNEWGGLGDFLDPHSLSQEVPDDQEQSKSISEAGARFEENLQSRIGRASSPPNEASEEDKWPFMWNPNSRQILKALPLHMPDDHPLFQNHYSRFDITEATLLRLNFFLQPPAGREFHQSQKGSFVLPSLAVINVFIRLFFENFSHHMPVLHHPTVNTNTDLPPPLLAVIIVIGAIYSNVKHTRRFSIVLLDIVRWHQQIAIECDNSLMRDPMIIYAQALICHTGLWGGNKRAFELAEVVRGGLVTYIRRVRFGEPFKNERQPRDLQEEWKQWISEESQRRLAWVVYAIDSYFPSILNLPPTISMGEVRNLACPCDEDFWAAESAQSWKSLLGRANVPPSRSFAAAVGPFVLPGAPGGLGRGLPAVHLNSWSAFLVLQSMTHHIFQFSFDSMIARTFMNDDPCEDETLYPPGDPNNFLRKFHAERHAQLADSLDAWAAAYLSRSQSHFHPASRRFHACSVVIHHLSTILLDIPLSDLQNAIGKDGIGGIVQAMTNLTNWARRSPHIADQVAYNATKTIVSLAPSNVLGDDGIRNADTAPYSQIAIFLCHIVLWAYASVTSREQKIRLMENVIQHPALRMSAFVVLLKRALGLEDGQDKDGEPKLLFRSGAEMLTRLGTWGGSLNLALLLHGRAEMDILWQNLKAALMLNDLRCD